MHPWRLARFFSTLSTICGVVGVVLLLLAILSSGLPFQPQEGFFDRTLSASERHALILFLLACAALSLVPVARHIGAWNARGRARRKRRAGTVELDEHGGLSE